MFIIFLKQYLNTIFKAKYPISTPLLIENPVSSPIVPPIAERISTNLADLSLIILSKTGESKFILIYLKGALRSYSTKLYFCLHCKSQ